MILRRIPYPALLVATSMILACGDAAEESTGTIDRETFIATYVDLRVAALRPDSPQLDDEERATVLSRHGITEEQLTRFAEIHGEDVTFMRDVWDEVEARLDAQRTFPDSTGAP